LGDHPSSLLHFDKAISLQPKFYQALYGKGVILREMGDHDTAFTYFNKAVSLNPTYQEDHWLTPIKPTSPPLPAKISESESISHIRLDLSKSSRGPDGELGRSKGADVCKELGISKGPFEII